VPDAGATVQGLVGTSIAVERHRADITSQGGAVEKAMQPKELEDVIRRIELVEDDVLRFIEDCPQLIKSRSTLDVLRRLKAALASLRAVREKLAGMQSATFPPPEAFQYRILRKPH
jgi:hypothetical protein